MGIAVPQRGDSGVFGVAAAPFQPLQDQHPVAFVLADAPSNRLQRLAEGAGGFALALPGVDLDAAAHVQRDHPLLLQPWPPVRPHLGVQVRHPHQWSRCRAASHDDFHALRPLPEGVDHVLHIQQPQIEHRVQFIQHHHRIERAGDRSFGDHPAPLGFLPIEAGGFFSGEVIGTARAQVVDQMRETLLQRFDGGVFVVGAARALEEAQQQHPGASLFTDAQADGAQHHPQGGLALALALTVIDVQLTMAALAAVRRRHDADASGHGPGSYRWSLPRSTGLFR